MNKYGNRQMHWSDHKMAGMSLAYLANVWKIQVYYHIQWEKLSLLNTAVMIVKQDMLMIWKVYLSSVDLCSVSFVDCAFDHLHPHQNNRRAPFFSLALETKRKLWMVVWRVYLKCSFYPINHAKWHKNTNGDWKWEWMHIIQDQLLLVK